MSRVGGGVCHHAAAPHPMPFANAYAIDLPTQGEVRKDNV